MKLLNSKFILAIFLCTSLLWVTPSFAGAPDVKVHVVVENSGTLAPVGGAYIRWQNRCQGSYNYTCDYNTAKTPRRYGKTAVDGTYTYVSFQKANLGQEYATILDGLTDADYEGPVRMLQPQDGRFGCGQKEHKIAVQAEGYVCDQMKSGTPTDNTPFEKIGCANGWCQGDLLFTDDCTNGCPQKDYTFKCKAQKITDLGKDVKRSEVGLGADDEESQQNAKWGFGCATTAFCRSADNTTPVPENQKGDYEVCNDYPSTGGGPVKKKVKLIGVQSLYDKTYIQQQSENIEAYIVECINQSGSYKCTTGNAGMDQTVFGQSNVPGGYKLEMFKSSTNTQLTNPVIYSQLDEDIVVISSSNAAISSFFMLVYPQDRVASAQQATDTNSQRQATLTTSNACRVIQDPYGRVFDSHTLEPIEAATVELTAQNEKGAFVRATSANSLLQLVNPQKTLEDGMFSFNVLDGVYRLAASKTGYVKGVSNVLNKYAAELYSNIYLGDDIVQKGAPVHRDIPLQPEDTAKAEAFAKSNPAIVMNHMQFVNKQVRTYTIEGRVSHPKSVVIAYGRRTKTDGTIVRSDMLGRVESDSFGRFTITFPLSKIKSNETVGELEVIKKRVIGETIKNTVQLQPVFDSIRGYAYSANGEKMPNAQVAIMGPFDNPLYSTQADADGRFEIKSENLPAIPYSITFTNEEGTTEELDTATLYARNTKDIRGNYVAFNNPTKSNGTVAGANTQVFGVADAGSPGPIKESPLIAFIGGIIGLSVIVAVAMVAVWSSFIKKPAHTHRRQLEKS